MAGNPVIWPAPPFSTGTYRVQLTGYDGSTDPQLPPCATPAGMPPAGKSVNFELKVARDGNDWVGRASGPADIELRFHDAGDIMGGRRRLAGTIRGRAPDAGFPGIYPPSGVTVRVAGDGADGTAVIEGQTAFSYSTTLLVGRASGDFRFVDASGNTGVCTVVSFNINAPQG
jgi:hypothetical protein